MEKKNTILLTVIAVATLLVAVVGATFAYYSLNVTSAQGTVNVGVKADELGKITLTSKTGKLQMNVSPTDMAKLGEVRDYYATTSGNLVQIPQKTEIAKATLTESGADNTTYVCTSTVKVTLTTGDDTMGSALELGDAAFVLTSDSENVSIETGTDDDKQISLDLSTLKNDDEHFEEFTVTYTLGSSGTGKKTAESLYGDLKITNKDNADQSYLTDTTDGKQLEVKVETTKFDCEIAKIG